MNLLATIWTIIQIILKIFKKEPENTDQKFLELNIALERAIKEGNGVEVARIRELLINYKNLVCLVLCVVLCGCGTFKTPYVPLSSGDVPYEIKTPVVIEDTNGILHKEETNRWSVPQSYVYKSITALEQNPVEKTTKIISYFEKYTPYFLGIFGVLILLKIVEIVVNSYKEKHI